MKAWRALLVGAILNGPEAAMTQPGRSWDFVVRLDGKVVGAHRFVREESAGGQRITSTARFDVDVMGFIVYRYRHTSRELWRDGCLTRIEARSDAGGKHTEVHGHGTPSAFLVEGADAPVTGCLMTFAYWNPDLPRQTRLLDPGSGRVVPVRIEHIGTGSRWRITGLPNPIEIEWDDQRWIALDTFVSGRHLTYRLQ